ncbi:MAG: transporter substrate-binding domain-containing protein [Bacteroidales bacterium]|nr:transporter substrate-binding domain-containing protein [Bacteroidales bacterium]
MLYILSDFIKNLKLPILFILLLVLTFNTCRDKEKESFSSLNSIEKIKKRGKLVAVMDYNSTNYFIYRGEPMGYQYELLKLLAEELDVKLEIKVENDIDKNFEMLKKGDCDIIGINLTVTKERSKTIDFTYPHSQTHQVLIQRKPENWTNLSKDELEANLLRNQLNLAGKVIYVQKGTSYEQRMMNLSDEIGDSIKLIRKSDKEVEELIELVARGEIDYTVADENIALVNQIYYPILDVKTAVSFPQNLAWGLKKGDDLLKLEIDLWLKEFKKSTKYALIYAKYFKNKRSVKIVESDYYAKNSGKVSGYDNYIKKYSKNVDWDWRLLASLIYQESRFKPNVKSWAGAFGLMQLMPTTAKRFGVNKSSSPESNIKAGVDFIKWLDKRFVKRGITDEEEKIKFVLASYNVGLGHILDARRLAEKNGKNPDVWENNVDDYILKKSKPQYYKDPVVKYGYCRGTETYNYVIEIMDRFEHYKNVIPET